MEDFNWLKIAVGVIVGLIGLHFSLRKSSSEYRAIWRKVRRLNESSRIDLMIERCRLLLAKGRNGPSRATEAPGAPAVGASDVLRPSEGR